MAIKQPPLQTHQCPTAWYCTEPSQTKNVSDTCTFVADFAKVSLQPIKNCSRNLLTKTNQPTSQPTSQPCGGSYIIPALNFIWEWALGSIQMLALGNGKIKRFVEGSEPCFFFKDAQHNAFPEKAEVPVCCAAFSKTRQTCINVGNQLTEIDDWQEKLSARRPGIFRHLFGVCLNETYLSLHVSL